MIVRRASGLRRVKDFDTTNGKRAKLTTAVVFCSNPPFGYPWAYANAAIQAIASYEVYDGFTVGS